MKKILFSISNPPVKQYCFTRHNVGRLFVDEFLLKKLKSIKTQQRKYTQYQFKEYPNLIVCTSQTYMNLSGKAVESFVAKNKNIFLKDVNHNKSLKDIVKDHFFIIHDDLEHKFGNVRIKQKGSAEGHNGIKSIISSIGSMDFKRLQIGIDRPDSNDPQIVARYVLANFKSDEIKILKQTVFPKVFAFMQKQQII